MGELSEEQLELKRKKNRDWMKNWRLNNPEKAKKRDREWREKNYEKYIENKKRWYLEHPEKVKEMILRGQIKNKEKIKESKRKYHIKNREKLNKKTKKHYMEHREDYIKKSVAWANKHPEQSRENWFRSKLLKRYNLTDNQYKEMLDGQGGICSICGKTNENGKKLCIDHDHKTNEIRGLLCGKCNSALGLFNDDPDLLRAAERYLTEHNLKFRGK